ncbi:MAG: hypothetical protein V1781_03230 [Bacteroidota bacterium]
MENMKHLLLNIFHLMVQIKQYTLVKINLIFFFYIDKLSEDVDFIQKIIWSENNTHVCFITKDFLITTNTINFNILKIKLSGEWIWKKSKLGTFSSSNLSKEIVNEKFYNEIFEFKFKGDTAIHRLNLNY